jgi:two-component system, NarL family, response regulator DegU
MAGTIQLERVRSGHDISDRNAEAPSNFRSGQPLSGREVQVLRLLAEGKKNAEIARQLFISRQTVKKHVSSIFAKLQADNRVQAAVYAVRNGII